MSSQYYIFSISVVIIPLSPQELKLESKPIPTPCLLLLSSFPLFSLPLLTPPLSLSHNSSTLHLPFPSPLPLLSPSLPLSPSRAWEAL